MEGEGLGGGGRARRKGEGLGGGGRARRARRRRRKG